MFSNEIYDIVEFSWTNMIFYTLGMTYIKVTKIKKSWNGNFRFLMPSTTNLRFPYIGRFNVTRNLIGNVAIL